MRRVTYTNAQGDEVGEDFRELHRVLDVCGGLRVRHCLAGLNSFFCGRNGGFLCLCPDTTSRLSLLGRGGTSSF